MTTKHIDPQNEIVFSQLISIPFSASIASSSCIHPLGKEDRVDAFDKVVKNLVVPHFPEELRSPFASAFLFSGSISLPCPMSLDSKTEVSGVKFCLFHVVISLFLVVIRLVAPICSN